MTFLSHRDGGILLNTFLRGTTSERAAFVFTQSFILSAKQKAVETNFEVFELTGFQLGV